MQKLQLYDSIHMKDILKKRKKNTLESGVVAHSYTSSTWEAEAVRLASVQCQHGVSDQCEQELVSEKQINTFQFNFCFNDFQ